jgi:hypothetical protein
MCQKATFWTRNRNFVNPIHGMKRSKLFKLRKAFFDRMYVSGDNPNRGARPEWRSSLAGEAGNR